MHDQRPQQPIRRWKRKRTAAAALLLLAGGAVLNVAVAWCIAIAHPPRLQDWADSGDFNDRAVYRDSDYTLRVLRRHWSGRQLVRFTWGVHVSVGVRPARPPHPTMEVVQKAPISGTHPFDLLTSHERVIVRSSWTRGHSFMTYGWPQLSMWKGYMGTELRAVGRPITNVPLRPVFPGFIINTLFYALLLWLLFFAPFAARRMLRRRRAFQGLCEKCAYPIGVSPVCTECGAAVARRAEQ